jgi:hypothetical protein
MAHMKRSRMMMIPFIIMFIWGVFLIMRPRQQVQVTKVVETFTKRESEGTKSSRTYKTVPYAVVEVDYNGETATVTVHDNTWIPIKPGDHVLVTKSITGKIVEYESGTGYEFAGCGAFCTALIFAIDWCVGKHGH